MAQLNLPQPSSPDLVTGKDGRMRPRWAVTTPEMQHYYDTEWGMPVWTEQGLFERISLEIFQAGLSWRTVLEKRPALRLAFANFDVDTVADFSDSYQQTLLKDPGIIRNRRKIAAIRHNARVTQSLRGRGGLPNLVWSFQPERTPMPKLQADVPKTSPEAIALAATLRAHGFKFVGPVTMFALMEAIGMVDTHLLGSFRRGSSELWTADGARVKAPPLD